MNGHWSGSVIGIGAVLLALSGILPLVWSLIGDRSRGRKRCQRCWYDMSANRPIGGAWTCPECAKPAHRECQLLRPRRSWRLACLGIGVLLSAYPVALVPDARRHGVASVLPSSLLVLIAPIKAEDIELWEEEYLSCYGFVGDSSFTKELLKRARDRELSSWQCKMLIDRFLDAQPRYVWERVLAREQWPANQPVVVNPYVISLAMPFDGPDVMFRFRAKPDGQWIEELHYEHYRRLEPSAMSLGAFPAGEITIEGELLQGVRVTKHEDHSLTVDRSSTKRVWRADIATIQIGVPAKDLIETVSSDRSDQQIAKNLQAMTTDDEGNPWISMIEFTRVGEHANTDWGLGMRIDVFAGERRIATGPVLMEMHRPGGPFGCIVGYNQLFELAWVDGSVDLSALESVTVRAVSDANTALGDFKRNVFWEGKVSATVPLLDESWMRSDIRGLKQKRVSR